MDRRRFTSLFLGGSLLAALASIFFPIVRFLLPSKREGPLQTRAAAGKAGDLAPDSARIFRFGSNPAILIKTADGRLLAFTAVCTHLNCTVAYEASSGTLFCPCHNGRFDLSGRVVSGPPPAPLPAFDVQVVGDDVFVSRKS